MKRHCIPFLDTSLCRLSGHIPWTRGSGFRVASTWESCSTRKLMLAPTSTRPLILGSSCCPLQSEARLLANPRKFVPGVTWFLVLKHGILNSLSIYIYTHAYRERERDLYIHIYIYVYVYVYIYLFSYPPRHTRCCSWWLQDNLTPVVSIVYDRRRSPRSQPRGPSAVP